MLGKTRKKIVEYGWIFFKAISFYASCFFVSCLLMESGRIGARGGGGSISPARGFQTQIMFARIAPSIANVAVVKSSRREGES